MTTPGNDNNAAEIYTGKPCASMQSIIDQLIQNNPDAIDPTLLPPEEGREVALLATIMWNTNLPKMARIDPLSLTGAANNMLRARLYTPHEHQDGLIFFIHGGGFAFGDIDSHDRLCRCLAVETGCSLLSVNYRLAPEHPFPAGLNDCIAIFRQLDMIHDAFPWTLGHTAIAGDSAGANLALALMIHEQQAGRAVPDMGLLFYGVYGTDMNTRSYKEFANGPGLTRDKMSRYLDWYSAPEERGNSLVSMNTASDEVLARLPPLYLNAAEIDPLCSDTQTLHARLIALGRDDKFQLVAGVVHGFMQMTNKLDEACTATADAARAYRAKSASIHKSLSTPLTSPQRISQ